MRRLGSVGIAVACAAAVSLQLSSGLLAANAAIAIMNLQFVPADLPVSVGDTVTWTNGDATVHTVTSDDNTSFSSGNVAPRLTFAHRFDSAGTFPYHCNIHSGMHGVVRVTGGPATTSTTTNPSRSTTTSPKQSTTTAAGGSTGSSTTTAAKGSTTTTFGFPTTTRASPSGTIGFPSAVDGSSPDIAAGVDLSTAADDGGAGVGALVFVGAVAAATAAVLGLGSFLLWRRFPRRPI